MHTIAGTAGAGTKLPTRPSVVRSDDIRRVIGHLIILVMPHHARFCAAARRTALATAVGAVAVSASLAGVGAAHASPGENLPPNCLQFSQQGSTWGGVQSIDWTHAIPTPGEQVEQASFQVRNVCDTPARVQVWVGEWTVTGGGSANARANAGAVKGTTVALAGDPGILAVQTGRITKDAAIPVQLFVGIPRAETAQGYRIDPDWSIALEEVAPDAPTDPTDPVDPGGNGSSGSSSGSLSDIFGNLGGSSGTKARAAASTGTDLDVPAVRAATR